MKEHFSHVKAPKYTKQDKCDTCIELKDKRSKAKTDEEKQEFHKLYKEVIFQSIILISSIMLNKCKKDFCTNQDV